MLRHELGDRVELVAISNCPQESVSTLESCGVDRVVWIAKNSGHHDGCRDAFNSVAPFVGGYKTIVQQHVKSWLTDPKAYLDAVEERIARRGMHAAFLDRGEHGSMGVQEHQGEWLDCFAMSSDGYQAVFPYTFPVDGHLWNECHVYERSRSMNVSYLECESIPKHMGDRARKRFVSIDRKKGSDLLSYYDVDEKLKLLEELRSDLIEVARRALG